MNKILIIVLLLGASNVLAQTQTDSLLLKEIPSLQKALTEQKQEIERLTADIYRVDSLNFAKDRIINELARKIGVIDYNYRALTTSINSQQSLANKQGLAIDELLSETQKLKKSKDSLSKLIIANNEELALITDTLGTKIQQTSENANSQISQLGVDVKDNRLYWIIASLVTLLLGVLMFLFLDKRIVSSKTDLEIQIKETKKSLEEESLKLDNKLIGVLETQLKVQQEEFKIQPNTTAEKVDHSLALKVADEIVRMQKNISRMDTEIKGLKPLEKGIERIQANFAANGYKMVNLLNSAYDERMNIDVINFVEDETLESGNKIISKIIKPQVNFNGILIQRAQVEVSQN